MISSISIQELRTAHRELVRNVGIPLPFDEQRLLELARSQERLLYDLPDDIDYVVLTLTMHILVSCAGLRMMEGDLDRRLGLLVADRWLSNEGYLLLPPPHEGRRLLELLVSTPVLPKPPPDKLLDEVEAWVAVNVLSRQTGKTLAESLEIRSTRMSLRCFVSCALTHASDREILMLKQTCDQVANTMSEVGILCHQPVLYSDPAVSQVSANDSVYRAIDERLIASCDLVVVVASMPSIGLGVVASLSQRYGARLIVVTSLADTTPMLTGMIPPPILFNDDVHLAENLRDYLSLHISEIQDLAWEREQRRADLRARIDAVARDFNNHAAGDLTLARNDRLPRERLAEILSHPDMFAGATVREYSEVLSLTSSVKMSELTLNQCRALLRVERDLNWSTEKTDEIAELGRMTIGGTLSAAHAAEHVEFWIRIADGYRRGHGGTY